MDIKDITVFFKIARKNKKINDIDKSYECPINKYSIVKLKNFIIF